ncbi:MAG: extracellular solute-binding protein [Lachnospiraceae bacterium]|nr:extracellular solute-binding protein [Lachnospiraceae bacterium]
MKKKILALFMAMTMAAGLAACSSPTSAPSQDAPETNTESNSQSQETDAGEKVMLRMLSTQPNVGEEIMDNFMAENPNIEIEFIYCTSADYSAKFAALASAGEIPDVFWTQSAYYMDQITDEMLMDLTDYMDTDCYEGDMPWGETYEPILLSNMTNLVTQTLGEKYSDKIYGVPFSMTTVAVLYNKTIYEELGLKAPETWEEFQANCQTLVDNGYAAINHQNNNCVDWFPRLFWDQYCRDEIDTQGLTFEDGTMTFSSKSVQQGLIAMKEMWDAGYFPENSMTADLQGVQQAFIQGVLAQVMITPTNLEYIMDHAPEDMELATYVLPGIAGLPTRSLGGASNIFAISATTEHPEEAVLLTKYLTSRKNYQTASSLRYTASGLVNMEFDDTMEDIMTAYNQASSNGFCPDIYVPTNVSAEINTTFMTDLLPNYLSGQYDLDYVCSQLQALYDEYLAGLN